MIMINQGYKVQLFPKLCMLFVDVSRKKICQYLSPFYIHHFDYNFTLINEWFYFTDIYQHFAFIL